MSEPKGSLSIDVIVAHATRLNRHNIFQAPRNCTGIVKKTLSN